MRRLDFFYRSFVVVVGVAVGVATLLSSVAGIAETDLYVSGAGRLIPLALPKFCDGGSVSNGKDSIPDIIAKDLAMSALFHVVPSEAYLKQSSCGGSIEQVVDSDWTVIGVDGVAMGEITREGDRLKARIIFHDVAKKSVAFGKEYRAEASDVRAIAHKFANEIVRYYTGEPGFFGSRIVYSSKVGRFKELFVVDADGENVRQLTNDKSLSLSPSINAAGDTVIFTSYRRRVPDLFTINIDSRKLSSITSSKALEVGPRFSRKGYGILVSVTTDKGSGLIELDEDGSLRRRISPPGSTIEVSADWSPDGKQIVFNSNRAGSPQVYVMNADGSDARRISFTSSNYCTSPTWSPKGDLIAFVCRADGGFNIFTVNPNGDNPRQLTSVGNNEDPDWSPDGRWIVFSSTFGIGIPSLTIMKADGTGVRQLTKARTADTEPTWGPVP